MFEMRRLRGPIQGSEEDSGTENNGDGSGGSASTGQQQTQEPPPVTQADLDVLKAQLKSVGEKNQEMEGMLMDPSYIEFLGKQKDANQNDSNDKINEMDNAELVAHMSQNFGTQLEAAVEKITGAASAKSAQAEVASFREKHGDFDLYKNEMIKIAEENPNLSVKRVYGLAKQEVGPRSFPKAAGSELPGNQPPGEAPPTKGFKEHFDKSWNNSGIGKILKEVS